MEKKLRVGVLGATGMVGQRFISLLENHPWYEVVTVAASPRSAGKTYEEAVGGRWKMTTPMPEAVKKLVVMNVNEVEKVASSVDFVFSAVDMTKEEIKAIEEAYAKTETPVVSNNSAHRWTPDVPMVVPEINPEHFKVIEFQKKRLGTKKGFVAVKPNCSIQSYAPVPVSYTHLAGKSSKTAEAASGNAVLEHLRNLQNLLLATLFLFSLLSVFRVISWPVLVVVVLTGCLLLAGVFHSSFLPKKVDYSLLLTFIAFFVFIGNMKRIDLIREFLNQTLHGRELLLSFGCSQIISNVPAAILLSGFTDQYAALLRGVNIGGLGTLIASLASLISYKFFAESQARFPEAGSKQSYILRFTIWNVGMAIILLLAAVMLDW